MFYISVITWYFGNEEEFYTVENSHITGCEQRNEYVYSNNKKIFA